MRRGGKHYGLGSRVPSRPCNTSIASSDLLPLILPLLPRPPRPIPRPHTPPVPPTFLGKSSIM